MTNLKSREYIIEILNQNQNQNIISLVEILNKDKFFNLRKAMNIPEQSIFKWDSQFEQATYDSWSINRFSNYH